MPIGACSNALRNRSCASRSSASAQPAVGEVAGADDDALDRRVVEQVGGHGLDDAPAAVGVTEAYLDAVGVRDRARVRSKPRVAMARSSGWIRSNTSVPIRGSMSRPRMRSVTGLAYTSRPCGSTIAMMSLESRTIARKRASLRSRSAVTWSTVRAARRPTTRVETIARTTIATSTTPARIPSATHVLSVGISGPSDLERRAPGAGQAERSPSSASTTARAAAVGVMEPAATSSLEPPGQGTGGAGRRRGRRGASR